MGRKGTLGGSEAEAAELLLAGFEVFLLKEASEASTFIFLALEGGPIFSFG